MEKDYKAMDVRSLLKEVETMCGWNGSMKERISESIFSARKTEEVSTLIGLHMRGLEHLMEHIEAAKKALEETIVFYLFAGMHKEDGGITSMAFYDLDEARQEAEAWKKDNDGYVYIAICVTTETEVNELLKALPEHFYNSHEEFKNPRDEYSLSVCCNSDMIFSEIVSELDEEIDL